MQDLSAFTRNFTFSYCSKRGSHQILECKDSFFSINKWQRKYFSLTCLILQTPNTNDLYCTHGCSHFRHFHFRHFQNCCNRDGNTIFKYMNYVPIVVATDLEVHFSVLKKGVSQYFCLYSVCTSHWCLVMSFWLKVCIYSHTRGVKLGLGLGFMQTSQVLPHWLNQSFSFWTLSYTQRHCHVRIEKGPNCCYNIRSTQFPRISLYA